MFARMSCGLAILALAQTGWAEGEQKFAELGTCRLESGQIVSDCRIGYRTFGTLNAQKSNAVLFPTWFTGRTASLVYLVGPGKLVDSTRWFVVLLDALGDGVSSSPSNSKQQGRQKFPEFTIADMVQTEHRVATETLHLSHVHAVMGISMGGMQTFQWVFSYSDFMDAAVPIVGSPQLTSTDLLLWTAELHAIEENAKWQNGNYTDHPEMRAVTDIHQFALMTPSYRAEHPGRAGFREFITKAEADTSFDWNDWYRQLQAMMSLNVAKPWGGSIEEAAKHVKPKMLIVASEQDHMVNPLPGLKLARLAGERTLVLRGNCGHLAPGCEEGAISKEVAAFLSERN